MDEFFNHQSYLFLFAHPDEEIYLCATIQKLIGTGKTVTIIYVTSGDADGPQYGPIREKEIEATSALMGLDMKNVKFLRIPEGVLLGHLLQVAKNAHHMATRKAVDCIVTHDFEGGHSAHDALCYVGLRIATNIALYTFPAYHDWPQWRKYNQFLSDHPASVEVLLDAMQIGLKKAVMESHVSQQDFMNRLIMSDSADQFFAAEKLRKITQAYDFTKPPTDPLGYEFPGSRIPFERFMLAIRNVGEI